MKSRLLPFVSLVVLLGGSLGAFSLVSAEDCIPAKPVTVAFLSPPPVLLPPLMVKREGEDKKVADAPPVVLKTEPASGSEGVDPTTKEIRVTFSKTMTDKSWSWCTDLRYGADLDGEEVRFDKDKKTCVMTVKLKPETTYATWLNAGKFTAFKDTDGQSSVPYLLVFRTGRAK